MLSQTITILVEEYLEMIWWRKIKPKLRGQLKKEKKCLGWILDTRRLLVQSPDHKNIGWKSQIQKVLEEKSVGWKELASILGRSENVAQVLVVLGHFLGNIRHLEIL